MKKIPSLLLLLCASAVPIHAQLSPEQHTTLVDTARWLSTLDIDYRENWQPPDSGERWMMDCSNTSRYIYRHVFQHNLPRTASGQYYELHQQGKVFPAPLAADGSVDTEKLISELRSGDLLFWEWTYDIKRNPPITHVMVYLGRTANGTPRMAGSATRSTGETTRSGGVNVYNFNPNANMGGVKNFFGSYVKRARFVGYGRPFLQAEPVQADAAAASPSQPKS